MNKILTTASYFYAALISLVVPMQFIPREGMEQFVYMVQLINPDMTYATFEGKAGTVVFGEFKPVLVWLSSSLQLFMHNFIAVLMPVSVSFIPFGIFYIWSFLINVVVSAVGIYVMRATGFSAMSIFRAIILHGMIEMFAFCIAFAISHKNVLEHYDQPFKIRLRRSYEVMLGVVVPLLFVAAMIEATV